MWTGRATEEGVVVNWFKVEGAPVRKDEVVAEVMIEKVTIEVGSPTDGVLAQILVPQGGVVRPGQPLALISSHIQEEAVAVETQPVPAAPAREETFVPATPAARRLARELGVDLTRVVPSGPGGRVTEEDVRRYHQAGQAVPEYEELPLSGIRKITAERMMESLKRSAQLTLFMEADATQLVSLKEAGNLPEGVTYTDLLARAVVIALQRHNSLNAHFIDGTIRRYKAVHLGIAVALPDGLIVPVVRNAQGLSLAQLAAEIHRLVQAARSGGLKPSEATGSTFTITNLGMYETDFFTPVINPPEVAILGVGRIFHRVRPATQGFETYRSLPLSLTIDHQVVDGAMGAEFLKDLAGLLRSPEALYA
jgi:pyruvate dehydrogenase E2 component (dihydrolipoamide acetyltransferase)